MKKALKVNQRYHAVRDEHKMLYFDQNFQKALELDAINQSSSESASSYSESCANFETAEASNLTGLMSYILCALFLK